MYQRCQQAFSDEREAGETLEQVIYKTRRKARGTFERALRALPEADRSQLRNGSQDQFEFHFRPLAVENAQDMVAPDVAPPKRHRPGSNALRIEAAAHDRDLWG